MYLIFDIGGTKMRIATSVDLKKFNEPTIVETPRVYEEGIALFKHTAKELIGGESLKAVAGGIAGPFSQKKESLVASPNLQGWIGKPLLEELESSFNVPVHIVNDSALVGLGEAVVGAGKGYEIVVYMTVSTGVGGARLVNGKIDERFIGFEPGHQIIDADKTLCPDCDGIYLGNYISGKALEKRYGKKPYEIKDQSLWDDTLPKWLSYGLHNTIVHWSPEAIVLGGSMIIGDPAISVSATEEYLKDMLKIFPELPKIKKAELGDLGGLYGGMEILKQHID